MGEMDWTVSCGVCRRILVSCGELGGLPRSVRDYEGKSLVALVRWITARLRDRDLNKQELVMVV